MRFANVASLALVAIAVAACDQQTDSNAPTSPDLSPRFGKPTAGACSAASERTISSQQADLWSKPQLDSARARFALVQASCGTQSGKDLMLSYVQWTLDNKSAIVTQRKGTKESNLLDHWNTTFPYVGYVGQDQPSAVPIAIFSTEGAVGVIAGNAQGEITADNAALTSYPQNANGDQRSHLFVIYPINPNCLTGTNLRQYGPCFQFSAFPRVDPRFDPKVKVGICEPLSVNESLPLSVPALGHLSPVTRITENGGIYPTFCGDVASNTPAGSWNDGLGGVVKRLAWLAKTAITPRSLYAVHGGLGGQSEAMSPFGAVDLDVFRATFSADAIGLPPVTPETGSWFQQVRSPGSILVQGSLGQQASKLVVLNQAGGNCANCGGLLLQGNLASAGTPAVDGVYDAEFVALQDQSNMKEASFVIRDTNGREIARLTYAVRSNVNVIVYNNSQATAGTPVGNWAQSRPDQFRIRVNLNTKTTSLWFNGAPVPGASAVPFVQSNAANLASISADFTGIDSGTMGWDDVRVTRLADLD